MASRYSDWYNQKINYQSGSVQEQKTPQNKYGNPFNISEFYNTKSSKHISGNNNGNENKVDKNNNSSANFNRNNYNANSNNNNEYVEPTINDYTVNARNNPNIKGKSHSDYNTSLSLKDITLSSFMGTDAYSGYETLNRMYRIIAAPTASMSAALVYQSKNVHYDYSALNQELKKNGFKEVLKSDNISANTFNKNMREALLNEETLIKVLKGTEYEKYIYSEPKTGPGGAVLKLSDKGKLHHIEYGKSIKNDFASGQITIVNNNKDKIKINLNKISVNTKDGVISGKNYMEKFIAARESKQRIIAQNAQNIDAYIKSNTMLAQLGLQHMNSTEIRKRLTDDKKGNFTFKGKYGKTVSLSEHEMRVIQDIAQNKSVFEANKLNKATTRRKRRVFMREAGEQIKDLDLYQGMITTKKMGGIVRRVIKAPIMIFNSRINKRRAFYEKKEAKYQRQKVHYESKVSKGKNTLYSQKKFELQTNKHLSRQKTYERYYGHKGALTRVQNAKKDVSRAVKNKVYKTGHQATATINNAAKNGVRAVGSKGREWRNKRVANFRNKHAVVDKTLNKYSVWRQKKTIRWQNSQTAKIMGKGRSVFNKAAKHFHPVTTFKKTAAFITTPFTFMKKIIVKVCIGFAAIVSIPILLAGLLEIFIPMFAVQITGGLTSAVAGVSYEEGQKQSAASTKDIYDMIHAEKPSMSTADILGIMSLMKYESDLNCYYENDNGNVGLLAFDEEEADAIEKICEDNNWGDPFNMEFEDEDSDVEDTEDSDDSLGVMVNADSLKSSRLAQIKYVISLLDENNYTTNIEMSVDSMISQALKFASDVRGIDTDNADITNAISKAATDMYYEYVMWDFEYLKASEDEDWGKITNTALLMFARTYAGEAVNMNTLFPGTSYSSITTDWSKWFVKYVISNAGLSDNTDMSYINQYYNDIGQMIEEADNKGFWHKYEEVYNTNAGTDKDNEPIDNGGIKPGYIMITSTGDENDKTYRMGIVLNVMYDWDEKCATEFTVIEGDAYGNNYITAENKIEKLGSFGSADDTTVCAQVYSMSNHKYTYNNTFDEEVNIEGFIAWYDPVYSMVNHEWENSQEEPETQEPDNSGDTDDSTDNSEDGSDNSLEDNKEEKCSYCGITREEYDEYGYECDAVGGNHTWIWE